MAGLTMTAHVLKQKGFDLYLFPMNSADLRRICYVTPRSHDDPTEVQRIRDPRRAKEIGDYIKQERVSDVHLLSLYYQIRELPSETAATMDVVQRLAKDTDSSLAGKIKLLDDDRGCWVTNRHIKSCIAPHTESGGVLHTKTAAAQSLILKEYLKGLQQFWPDAWGNNTDYMLTRAMGLETVLAIFPAAKHRCDLNEGKQYTAATFNRQLAPLRESNIEIPGGGKIPLTWARGPFGPLSNRAGKVLIQKQLNNYLRIADEAP